MEIWLGSMDWSSLGLPYLPFSFLHWFSSQQVSYFVLSLLPVDYHGREYSSGFSEPEADFSLYHSVHNQTDFPD